MEYVKGLVGILILANVFLSFFLISSPSGPTGYCILGTQCNSVQSSEYGEIFGIKVSWFGFTSFLGLLIIYLLSEYKKIPGKIFTISVVLGALFALYFIYLQFFILENICSTCMVIDGFMIIIASARIYDNIKRKNN